MKYHPNGFHLLSDKLSLTELQPLDETILDQKIDTRNFRKKSKHAITCRQKQTGVAHRATKRYSFDVCIYKFLKEEGLNFRI